MNSADFNEKQKCHVDILQDTFPTLCQWTDFFFTPNSIRMFIFLNIIFILTKLVYSGRDIT